MLGLTRPRQTYFGASEGESGSWSGGAGAPRRSRRQAPLTWVLHLLRQSFATRMSEIRLNQHAGASGSLDLTGVQASIADPRLRFSQGFFVTSQVFGLQEQPALIQRAPGGAY